MSDIGRAIAVSGLLGITMGDAGRRRREDDAWRRLHRRPDAEPLTEPVVGGRAAGARRRVGDAARRMTTAAFSRRPA